MISSILSFWTDRGDPLHYWKLIIAGWFIAILGAFPTLSILWGSDTLWPFAVLLGFPVAAHIYGVWANIQALKAMEDHTRVGPAFIGVCYVIAAVIGMTQIDILSALVLPFSAIIMAVLTFGIAFTGFAPLLGMLLVFFLLKHDMDKLNLAAAGIIMTAAWLLAMATGYFLGTL